MGSIVARTFAKEGARVFATGRRPEPVERVVKEIVADGGLAQAAQVDALDETAVERMGPAWAAMEHLSRGLSAELASEGVRSVVLRTTGLPETATIDVVFDLHAKPMGMTREQFQSLAEGFTHRRQSTRLAELANVAAFVASDRASAMTGTAANLTGGTID